MKKTKLSRVLAAALALLMLVGSFSVLPVSAAEDQEVRSSNAGIDAEYDALNASDYETYMTNTLAALYYDETARPKILLGAYNDGLDEEKGQAGVLHKIVEKLLKENKITEVDVDSEDDVLALDESTKTKIILELSREQVIRYLQGNSVVRVEDLHDYTFTGGETAPRLPAADDFSNAVDFRDGSLWLPDEGTVEWKLNIPEGQSGFYNIRIEYYPLEGNVSTIERMMRINGRVLFSEARSLAFTKLWSSDYFDGNDNGKPDYLEGLSPFQQDANGNDLRPTMTQAPEWRTYCCSDAEGFRSEYFEVYFEEGECTISLQGIREALIVGSISLVPAETLPTYEEYIDQMELKANGEHKLGSTVKRIEAELPLRVSDTSVYAANDRSSAINYPSKPDSQLYNVIGRSSYSSMGQWACYEFTVESTGFYEILLRYHQTSLEGLFVSRSIKLYSEKDGVHDGMYGLADGTPTVPFKEASAARFSYDKSWQVDACGNEDGTFEFYFEEGVTYYLYLEVSLGDLASIISTVQNSLAAINEAYLNILKLTGASPDEYRDYNFKQVMPGTIRSLYDQYKVLESVSAQLEEISGSKGSHVATLDRVSFLLERMSSDESEIASNLSNLKSYIGTLGTWINSSKAQPLTLDYVLIQNKDAKKPKSGAGIWESIVFECKSFIASFFVDYNSMGVTTKVEEGSATIDVWLATGRDQSLIWRNLIDNDFSKNSAGDVAVRLKLVTAATLLPSVLAGQGPAVYIGLDSASTVNYAIRSAILPIQDYEGFAERLGYDRYDEKTNTYYMNGQQVATRDVYFNYANMVPLTLYGRSYGVPETTNFPMLFYRKDVLQDMGISVPKTWDDLLSITPTFQSNNMQIGLGYAGAINIFIYQNGGSLWKYEDNEVYDERYAGARIGLDSDEALGAFRMLSRLYTDYSFPVSFDPANRFRTGEMPLIIADYCATYNQLIVFASEISGLWEFTDMPGTVRTDADGNEIVDNRSVASVTAVVMLAGCKYKEAAWEFMAWQCGADVQARYGNEMVALVGPAAKYSTANMQALKDLAWSTSEYKALANQFERLAAVPNYPGSYIISRYTNFAFLDAVNDGADPVEALQSYITTINKELERKREEFDGKVFEDGSRFDVPTLADGEEPPMKK